MKKENPHFLFSLDMLSTVDEAGYLTSVNPAFSRTLGFPEKEFLQKPLVRFVHPEDRAATVAEFSKFKSGVPCVYFENRCQHQDGSYRFLQWTAHGMAPEKLIYAVARDVTAQREMEKMLRQMAFTDDLTNLFNRRGFFMVAERMLKITYRRKIGFLLMVADLDGMKFINDNFGHREGDFALVTTAQLLRERFRDSDLVARLGGDEFAAAFLTDAGDIGENIQKSLENSFAEYNRQESRPYSLSLSMGFANASAEAKASVEHLMVRADQRMYQFKRRRSLTRLAG